MPGLLSAAAIVPAAFQFVNGLKQTREGKRMYVPPRPVMDTPESQRTATGLAQHIANGGMAGFGQAQAGLRTGTASTIRAAQETGSANNALAVVAAAGASEANAQQNLAVQNAQFQQRGQQVLLGELSRQAGYEQQAWDYNKRKPYEEAAAARSAKIQAGATNTMGGLTGIVSGVAAGAEAFMTGGASTLTPGVKSVGLPNTVDTGPYQGFGVRGGR